MFDRDIPRRAQLWRHYKGGTYEIVCVARRTEGEREADVIYRDWPEIQHGEPPHSRPLEMFMGKVAAEGAECFGLDPNLFSDVSEQINRFERWK